MIIPAASPVAFSLPGLPIYWYGIIMACAILVAVLLSNKLFNLHNPEKKDFVLSIAPIFIVAGIIGARLYFCTLNFSYYIEHPLEILDIRQGGLSIHGALIFGILTLIIASYKKSISFLKVFDALACGTILGQAIGRWGNYFNSEAYGLPVAGQGWGLYIPEKYRITQYFDYELFHPTFLYESVLNLLVFFVLLYLFKRFNRNYVGITFFSYLILYPIIRFFIEQIRVDSAFNLGSIPIAQVVSLVLFVVGFVGVFIIIKTNKKAE